MIAVAEIGIRPLSIQSTVKRMVADTVTPVSLYLRLRDRFANPLLLESSDYHGRENSLSFICLEPMATIKATKGIVNVKLPNQQEQITLVDRFQLPNLLQDFINAFQVTGNEITQTHNGIFGYSTYDSVQYFESIKFDQNQRETDIPDLQYSFYRYIIMINHFNNELFLIENLTEGETSKVQKVENIIRSNDLTIYPFELDGEETSNMTDEAYKAMVTRGKEHCQRGDVFQIVLARRFNQSYKGDDFNVYRALRIINPSPYLYYFDYGEFRIFGSSPEAQLVVKKGKAQIYPIAGTYRRTGDDEIDRVKALELAEDPKENAEHVMLVDLARNDLSRNTRNVEVIKYKEIQFFSHVIHLVSTVEGDLDAAAKTASVYGNTFPAGTLSGAPKHKAMQLIDKYETTNRSFYGGAIGFFGLQGNLNHAIIIRSFLSMNDTLHYQAGAGIVIDSVEESEKDEVFNKIAALRKALEMAENL